MSTKREELLMHEGKSWEQMDLQQRIDLWREDEDKARLMKEQHDERPWVGKTFGDMTRFDKHRLANDRPALYRQLQDEWEIARDAR